MSQVSPRLARQRRTADTETEISWTTENGSLTTGRLPGHNLCLPKKTARRVAEPFNPVNIGRDAGIRTRDPLTPRLFPSPAG